MLLYWHYLGTSKPSSVIEICGLSELIALGSDKLTSKLKQNCKLEKETPIYLADITKTKQALGWKPKVSLEQGIKKTWNFINS